MSAPGGRVLGERGELPEGPEKAAAVEAMFDRIAPRYDRLNRVISLGRDRAWRRHTVAALGLSPGSTVLDLACGTGDLCEDLRRAGHVAVGIDFSAGMLAAARTGAPLVRADALRLPVPDATVDGVVCGFALRNLVDLGAFLTECARVLRPGGRLGALDAADPSGPLARGVHTVWFRGAVPVVGRLLSADPEAYRYLPRSTAYLPEPTRLVAMARDAGFAEVERRTFMLGSVQLLLGSRA